MVVFNKTIIPLVLVVYEMIMANEAQYPTRARGIIVNYILYEKVLYFVKERDNNQCK